MSIIMSDVVFEMPHTLVRGVILQVSEKLNPLPNISRRTDGAPHIHTHLATGVPSS